MTRLTLLLCFLTTLTISCKEKEEINPYIAPTLEIKGANITEDDKLHAIALIKEKGSLPILEFGFLMSEKKPLSYDADLGWKSSDSPELEFEATLTEKTAQSVLYYLQAFLKTEKTITYSPVFEYRSPGPTTLTIDKLIFADTLYFGDTITVLARNLPEKVGEMYVKFQGGNAYVFDLTSTGFKFTLPKTATFDRRYRTEGSPFEFRVGDDIVRLTQKIVFRDAKFPSSAVLSMAGPWQITGKYLYGQNMFFVPGKDTETGGNLVVNGIEDNAITILPKAVFDTKRPQFMVLIRDSIYHLSHFQLKLPEFHPGQQVDFNHFGQIVTAKGSDFNAFVTPGDQILAEAPNQAVMFIHDATAEQVRFSVELTAPIQDRKIILHTNNYGEKSNIPFQVNYQIPAIPVSYLQPDGGESFIHDALGFSIGDQIHYFSPFGAVVFNPADRKLTNGGTNTVGFQSPSNFRVKFKGKHFFSHPPVAAGAIHATPMYVYNADKKEAEFANYLAQDGFITSSFSTADYIYYETQFIHGFTSEIRNLWRWKGTFNTGWELAKSDTLTQVDLYSQGKNFSWEEVNYRFIEVAEPGTGGVLDGLERFDEVNIKWIPIKTFPNRFDSDFRAFSTTEGIYLTNGIKFYRFDPIGLNITFLGENKAPPPQISTMVYHKGKFYYIRQDGPSLIYELDLSLLKP